MMAKKYSELSDENKKEEIEELATRLMPIRFQLLKTKGGSVTIKSTGHRFITGSDDFIRLVQPLL